MARKDELQGSCERVPRRDGKAEQRTSLFPRVAGAQGCRGARNGGGEVPQRVEHKGEHERPQREYTAAPSRPLLALRLGVHALHRMIDDSVRVSRNAIAESQCLTDLPAASCALMASSSRGWCRYAVLCRERERPLLRHPLHSTASLL